MYFKLGPKVKNNIFSWIIQKNPETEFERSISSDKRKVFCKFDEDEHFFEGSVKVDNIWFIEKMKGMNQPFYVHPTLSCVCPENLKGFDTVFRSAIRGKKPSEMDVETFFQKMDLEAIIGPFPENSDYVIKIFNIVGFKGYKLDTDTELSFMLKLETIEPMHVTEFLQKIYLISYYLTRYLNFSKVSMDLIEKFINISKEWLDKSTIRNSIINGLCKYNKDFMKKFDIEIMEDNEEKEDRIEMLEAWHNKTRLHDMRHNFILSKIKDITLDDSECKIIDLGAASGKLIFRIHKEFPNFKLLGIDQGKKLQKKVNSSKIELLRENILFLNIDSEWENPKLLIMTEFIEHLSIDDLNTLSKNIKSLICPENIIITTPNIEYNKIIGLKENELRHKGHFFEWTREEFKNYLVKYFPNYDFQFYNEEFIKDTDWETDENISPTHIVILKRKDNSKIKIDHKYRSKIKSLYNPVLLPISNYEIREKELLNGYTERAIRNIKNNFYLSPTMAPVDFNSQFPEYLEHPQTAFDYFKERGIEWLVEEKKYMGSRGEILIFKNEEKAKELGFKYPLIINSRNGYEFFYDDHKIMEDIYNDIKSIFDDQIKNDFIILDAEIMPWSLKASKLISRDFVAPGECSLLLRRYAKKGNKDNSVKFLNTLSHFTKNTKLEIRPFHILAIGDINRGRIRNIENGFIINHIKHMERIEKLCKGRKIFKPCEYNIVFLSSDFEKEKSIKRWKKYTEEKIGEGFVYKPLNPINFTKDLYYIQPSLKVRGREYLRIIYGIDYLEDDCFNKLVHRSIKRKRILAIQEYELGMYILKAFLTNNKFLRYRLISGFYGMESINSRNIDATL